MDNGFSVCRVNFRGVGKSDGEFDNGQGELADAAAALSPSGMWGIPPLVGHDRTWDGSPIAYGQQNKDEDWKVIGRKRDG